MVHTDLSCRINYNPKRFESKVILEREKQKTILFAFWEGQQIKEHTTDRDVLLILLEGECDLMVKQEWQRLKSGQVHLIPAYEPHALKAATNFKFVLVK